MRLLLVVIAYTFGFSLLDILKGDAGGKPLNECEDATLLEVQLDRSEQFERMGTKRYRERHTGTLVELLDCDRVRLQRHGVVRTLTINEMRHLSNGL